MTLILRRDLPDLRAIISGGQTGADEGGLDAAIDLGLAHGGWIPKGRRREGGQVPARYTMRETGSSNYGERTSLNIRDSTGTLLISRERTLTGGSAYTLERCLKRGRPVLHVALNAADSVSPGQAEQIRDWLRAHSVITLNVAGPRESREPGLALAVRVLLRDVLGEEVA